MAERPPWWLRGTTARARFAMGWVSLVAVLLFLCEVMLSHKWYAVLFAIIWLVLGAANFAMGVARRRWERFHLDSDSS